MLKSAERYVKEVKGIMNEMMSSISHEQIMELDVQEFKLLKSAFELLEASLTMIVDQASQMDEMNDKLDRLLKISEES